MMILKPMTSVTVNMIKKVKKAVMILNGIQDGPWEREVLKTTYFRK